MKVFAAACAIMGLVKATIPVLFCGTALLYCTFQVHQARNSYFPPGASYKVDIVVHPPEGTAIKQIQPAPH